MTTTVKKSSDITEEKIASLANFLKRALTERLKGNNADYVFFVKQLRSTLQSDPPKKNSRLVMALRAGYLALTRNVSLLGQHRVKFKDLLKSIFMFRFDWLVDSHEHTNKLFESYQKLLLNLLSSNSCFVPPVCRTLVTALTMKEENEESETTKTTKKGNKKKKEKQDKSFEQVCERVRDTILHMIKVAPSSQKSLQHALRDIFPHATKSVEIICYYVTNLLHLSDSIPLMREFVFCLIVEKIIKIDVLVSRFDTVEDEEDEKREEEDMSDDAEKLDRIMCLVFEFLKREMTKKNSKPEKDNEIDVEEEEEIVKTRSRGWSEVSDFSDHATTKDDNCKDMFMTTLRAFRTTVIHTHQSTCIQFIVFYAAQFDESLPSTFVGLLLDALANESLSEALRMTCVCYCASFVSRAKYIELGTVRAALSFLAFWLQDYLEKRINDTESENNSTTNEKKKEETITTSGLYVTRRDRVQTNEHNIFYCSVQALLYTLCFKTKSILSETDGIAFLQDLNLTALLSCSLNPLSRCLTDVASEFQSLALHVGWSSSLVEFLKQVVLRNDSISTATLKGNKNEEDMDEEEKKKNIAFDKFFPFDPYLLPKSGEMYVHQGIYNKWDESAIEVDEDEEEEEDEEEKAKDVEEVDEEEQEREHERYRQRLLRVGLGTDSSAISSSLVSSEAPDEVHPNLLEISFQKRKYRRSRSRGFSFESEKRRRKRPRIHSDGGGDESSFDTTIDRRKFRTVSMEDRPRMYSFDEILSRHSAPKRVEGSQSFGVAEKTTDEGGEGKETEDLTFLAGSW